MNVSFLEEKLKIRGEPKFRLKQIIKAIYQDGILDFGEMTVLPQSLRDYLKDEIAILPFEAEKIIISKDKKSIKALLKTKDGNFVETVLLYNKPENWSVCVSSQIGCPLSCSFCATGKSGYKRNLTSEEIEDQVLFWKNYSNNFESRNDNCHCERSEAISDSSAINTGIATVVPTITSRLPRNDAKVGFIVQDNKIKNSTISNIVFMGMGEPFLNLQAVFESIKSLTDPNLFGFGSRSISVSTAGVMDKWEEFSSALPQINLALSLHFSDDEKRSLYMPINKKYNLEKIRETLKKYFEIYKRKIFIEYIMFQGLNDSLEEARKLSEYLKSIGHSYLLHVNLIAYNSSVILNDSEETRTNIVNYNRQGSLPAGRQASTSTQDDNLFTASSKEKIIDFRNCLLKNKINATIRKSLGQDIQGACGQLAVRQPLL